MYCISKQSKICREEITEFLVDLQKPNLQREWQNRLRKRRLFQNGSNFKQEFLWY